MATVLTLREFGDEYVDIKQELDLMSAALQEDDFDAARHHQFVALVMANQLAREHKISDEIKSKNERIILSAEACVIQA